MREGQRAGVSGGGLVAMVALGLAGLGGQVSYPGPAVAMHEADHRFTVEGYLCGADGRPVPDVQVIVKDTRVSVGASGYTDRHGYYKATLHLHNENRGDPILVVALDQEQRVTAQFDVKDAEAERKATVNFGTGCEASAGGAPDWLYYGVGIGLVTAAVVAGAKLARSRQRSAKRGKRQRK